MKIKKKKRVTFGLQLNFSYICRRNSEITTKWEQKKNYVKGF